MTTTAPVDALSPAALRALVARTAADTAAWRPLVRRDAPGRGCALLLADGRVEVWVLSWSPGDDTGFHDHGASRAAIAVAEGTVAEERLTLGGPPRSQVLGPGAVAEVPAGHIHRIRQVGDARAVSIHAYSPPLEQMGTYAPDEDGLIERTPVGGDHELGA